MTVDVLNTDQSYWEKILAESDLSSDREIPQAVEITVEEFKEIKNLELLPEEDYEREDDPVITFNGITKGTDTLSNSGLTEANDELRTKIDGADVFFTGHRIVKPRRGRDRSETFRTCPEWAMSDAKTRELLLSSFPKLATNKKQRASAGRWARIIQLYYRKQMTHGQICTELGLSLPTIFSVIRSINRVASGKTSDKAVARKGSRGRPKKIML